MRTINLQTVYQLVITALLLGACLGLLGQRLPWLINGAISAFEQPVYAASSAMPSSASFAGAATAPQNQDVTTSKDNSEANVQVEVEVHTRGNANALARALGPGDTEVKANTEGEGDGRSAAYLKAPEAPAWTPPAQTPTALPMNSFPVDQTGQPKATVTQPVVNLRSSPDLIGAVMSTAQQGQEFAVIGRDLTNTWWLVCCDGGHSRWVYSAVVQVTGNVAAVPVIAPPSTTVIPTASQSLAIAPTPTIAPPVPTATPALQYEFMLAEQAQFEERITPRIHLYVYETGDGLVGYTARVRKDGRELPVTQKTGGGMPGITWPIPNERQRYTNLKLEFPNVAAAGLWEVQLLDAAGEPVGPTATFHLQPDDPQQEMYVKYRKR